MGKMTMNAGNDAMAQWAKRAIYIFEVIQQEIDSTVLYPTQLLVSLQIVVATVLAITVLPYVPCAPEND